MDSRWQRHLALFRLLAWLARDWQNGGPNRAAERVRYWLEVLDTEKSEK